MQLKQYMTMAPRENLPSYIKAKAEFEKANKNTPYVPLAIDKDNRYA
jgi:hypothetical protein